MTLPSTIHSLIDPAAVHKVTRLFNNTLADVLAELIQNARRAGASKVAIQTVPTSEFGTLIVTDNGIGMDDPSVLLALGRSGWDDTISRREDPAGMGVFSLAGRDIVIRSRPARHEFGWEVAIPGHAWEDGSPIPVSSVACAEGTQIEFPLDKSWADALAGAAQGAARHCPIPVHLNGVELTRQDWLAGAVAVYEEKGVRIGIFDDWRVNVHSHSINFHGVTVCGAFPAVTEKEAQWCARVDIVDASHLQLVLPARKEMVENEALKTLRRDVRRAIYRHVATRPSHRLDFSHWREAVDLGVDLPEAEPLLYQWSPMTSDIHVAATRSAMRVSEGILLVERSATALEQSADFAITRDGRFEGRLASPDPKMEGYGWYDRLARITGMAFDIERDGETIRYDEDNVPGFESGEIDCAELQLSIADGDRLEVASLPAPLIVAFDDASCWGVEEAAVLFASREAVNADEIVELLEGICFSPSDDRDADSWDTQHDWFLTNAREIAVELLDGEDAAILERLRAVLAQRAQWFIPEGRQIRTVISRAGLELSIEDAPPRSA